jgi:hypothetical protein
VLLLVKGKIFESEISVLDMFGFSFWWLKKVIHGFILLVQKIFIFSLENSVKSGSF